MATLTPTLTLSSTDAHSDTLSLSVTKALTVNSPSAGISKISTAANPLGLGAGFIIPEDTNQYYVYVKHTGKLASDGTTGCHASTDFITLTDTDGTNGVIIKLQPEEFAFFPIKEGDGSDGGANDGGLKVVAADNAVMIEYGFWSR
jgi:hypothetical protein